METIIGLTVPFLGTALGAAVVLMLRGGITEKTNAYKPQAPKTVQTVQNAETQNTKTNVNHLVANGSQKKTNAVVQEC